MSNLSGPFRILGYFTRVGDKTPPAALGSTEVVRHEAGVVILTTETPGLFGFRAVCHPGCCPVHATGGSLPRGRYWLVPFNFELRREHGVYGTPS